MPIGNFYPVNNVRLMSYKKLLQCSFDENLKNRKYPLRKFKKVDVSETKLQKFSTIFSCNWWVFCLVQIASPFWTIWYLLLTLMITNEQVYWSENQTFRIFTRKQSILRGNFMREIDCAHSRSVKMLPWPWFRENIDFFNLFNILVLGLKRRFSINKPRWCSDKAAAYWSQRSRVRIPLGAKFFCTK